MVCLRLLLRSGAEFYSFPALFVQVGRGLTKGSNLSNILSLKTLRSPCRRNFYLRMLDFFNICWCLYLTCSRSYNWQCVTGNSAYFCCASGRIIFFISWKILFENHLQHRSLGCIVTCSYLKFQFCELILWRIMKSCYAGYHGISFDGSCLLICCFAEVCGGLLDNPAGQYFRGFCTAAFLM